MAKNNSHSFRNRLLFLAFLWMIAFGLVIAKLVKVQVLEHQKYLELGRKHFENRRELPARRGDILDRNGAQMAVDILHYSLAVRPPALKNMEETVQKLASVLNMPASEIRRKIRSHKSFAYIAHRLPPRLAEKIRQYRLPGVVLEKKFSRHYPYHQMAAQTLGFCDYDNIARGGLELAYDEYLKGKPGWTIYLRDALGNQFPDLDYPATPALDGFTLVTSLDMVYQTILEEELRRTVERFQARQGSAILMRPQTGEILAMANYPGFDPNSYNEYPVRQMRNYAISDIFEPGSTFKIVAMALALEQLKLDMDSFKIDCNNGRYRLFRQVFYDHEPFSVLSLKAVFEKSSNIGVIKLARRFDPPVFYRYARDFGFGNTTGIDLPAEAKGILHTPPSYSVSSVYYMSIGYQVAATPLQILAAYAAIANQGRLMHPFLVKEIRSTNGRVIQRREPRLIREVISPQTAQLMTRVLEGVVEEGTGKSARIAGVRIAGKTGTAQKYDFSRQAYSSDNHVASFVGFFPVEDPRFALIVVVHEPRGAYYGSQVAAPAFRNIAQSIIGLHNETNSDEAEIPDTAEVAENDDVIPDLVGLEREVAIQLLQSNNFAYSTRGKGGLVLRQEPQPGQSYRKNIPIVLYTEVENGVEEQSIAYYRTMPDVKGLSLKEAIKILSELNIHPEIDGHGVVVDQAPRAGVKLSEKTQIKLVCKPA